VQTLGKAPSPESSRLQCSDGQAVEMLQGIWRLKMEGVRYKSIPIWTEWSLIINIVIKKSIKMKYFGTHKEEKQPSSIYLDTALPLKQLNVVWNTSHTFTPLTNDGCMNK
jgi:hypothetical protein